jgi:antitoxin ParD1/3/4
LARDRQKPRSVGRSFVFSCRAYDSRQGSVTLFRMHRGTIYATKVVRKAPIMSDVQKVSVALTPEFIALLKEAVETGEYTSASEVIRDALRHWKHHRAALEAGTEELRRLWEEGIASGPGRFKSIDQIKKEARRRAAKA